MTQHVLDELNEAQRAAVTAEDRALCIIAGPGTGKTKTLTARIAYLVREQRVAAQSILALTFTNKAAREMQRRVAELLDESEAAMPRITTFHGLCYELLAQAANASELHIASEADRLELLRSLRPPALKSLSTRELSLLVTQSKNMSEQPAADPNFARFLAAYNQALREQGLRDFDDLLLEIYQRCRDDDAFCRALQQTYRWILVDEFQDTNALQYELLRLLAGNDEASHGPTSAHCFVIGDPLQSIYGFRGASGNIFDRFQADFAARTITLTVNYRSAPTIVQLANAVFPQAPQLQAHQQIDGIAQAVQVLNEYREADWIVQSIEQAFGGTNFERSHRHSGQEQARRFQDFAVLYRTHHAARAVQRAFAASGIPHQIVGDESPYASKALRTAVAIFRARHCPEQPMPAAEARLLRRQNARLDANVDPSQTPTESLAAIAEAYQLLDEAATPAFRQSLGTLVRLDHLPPDKFLAEFDELAGCDFYDPNADAVTLMSIHASKGLEFAHVFLIGTEDGIVPHALPERLRAQTDEVDHAAHLAEERRLFYVAVTRAREELTLLHAKTRGGEAALLSPFAAELGNALPQAIDPDLQAQERARHKRHQKNAQTSMF